MWLAGKSRFDEFKTLLGKNGLGLMQDMRIDEVKLQNGDSSEEGAEPAYSISFMPGAGLAGAGRWFPFNGVSAGTLRIVQLLTYLIFDRASCMLLEQPEDSIHPGLLTKVIDILRTYSGRTQLICTTHSPRVLNIVGGKPFDLLRQMMGRRLPLNYPMGSWRRQQNISMTKEPSRSLLNT